MNFRKSGLALGLVCVFYIGSAFGGDCEDFSAQFKKDLPAIQRHGAGLFAIWKLVADKAPAAFVHARRLRAKEQYDSNPGNDLSRLAEADLVKAYPRLGVEVKIVVATAVGPDGVATGQAISTNAEGEPYFEICIDDAAQIPEAMSFGCGTVTMTKVPDQKTFIADYVNSVKSSRITNSTLSQASRLAAANGCPVAKKDGQNTPAATGTDGGDSAATKTADGPQAAAGGQSDKPAPSTAERNTR